MSIESGKQQRNVDGHPEGSPQGPWDPRAVGVDPEAKAKIPYNQHDNPKWYNNPRTRIAAGVAAVLAAGGIGYGIASSADSDPTKESAPTFESANDPDSTADAPAVNNPETSPTDIPSFDDEATDNEADPYAVDILTMSNEEVIEKYTLDGNLVKAQGTPWVLEQMRLFGSQPPQVDAQLMWDTDQNDPQTKDTGEIPTGYETENGDYVRFYQTLEDNLAIAMNLISANRDIINQAESAQSHTIIDGITVDLIRGREQSMNKQIEYFDARDESMVQKLIELVNSHPEGTVFTNVYLSVNTDTSGNNPDYGTSIVYGFRTPGSDLLDLQMSDETKLANQPVQQYNLAEKEVTPPGSSGQPVWYRDNFWDPYNPESTHAKSLFPRD